MPYQNRVTPFGALIAHPARGTLMGNRGCLVTPGGQLRPRPWRVRRWITCLLSFKGRRHPLWSPRQYTPLFFLDEATAFAAGHRPCAECRREDFKRFLNAWRLTQLLPHDRRLSVDAIDRRLHEERAGLDGEKQRYSARLADLPTGAFVLLQDDPTAYLVDGELLRAWSPPGYIHERPRLPHATVQVLTPRSLVDVFRAGYAPAITPAGAT